MADAKYLTIGTPIHLPVQNTTAMNNHIVDASNDAVAFAFQAQDANAITHLGFRYGTTPATPPTYQISLQGLSATSGNGYPNGTVKGGGSPASATFTPPADATWDGLWQWIALDNAYTPSRGEFLASVIEYSTGTIDGTNNSSFTSHTNIAQNVVFPIAWRKTAGTWARQTNASVFGVRTASSRYGCIVEADYQTRSASTIGHRVALKFTMPSDIGSTFKVIGADILGSISESSSAKLPVFGLWNAGGVVQNVTVDVDFVLGNVRLMRLLFDEASLTALTFGTAYYLGFEVADAASAGVIIRGFEVDNNADLASYPGGIDWHLATYDGSNWTDVTTVRPFVTPIVDDWTVPSGSGGGGPLIGGRLVR